MNGFYDATMQYLHPITADWVRFEVRASGDLMQDVRANALTEARKIYPGKYDLVEFLWAKPIHPLQVLGEQAE